MQVLIGCVLCCVLLLQVAVQAQTVQLSQGTLDGRRIQLTCSVLLTDTSQLMYKINLKCPISKMGLCYYNCTAGCTNCGLDLINRCDYYASQKAGEMKVTYVIDTYAIKESGQWSCMFSGQNSQEITLNKPPVVVPQDVVTEKPPVVATASTTLSTPTITVEAKKTDGSRLKAPIETDLHSSSQPSNVSTANVFSPPHPSVVFCLIGLLVASLILNMIFAIGCCLVHKYIKRNGLSYNDQSCLAKCLCLSRGKHYSPTRNLKEISSPQQFAPLVNNNQSGHDEYQFMPSSLHRTKFPVELSSNSGRESQVLMPQSELMPRRNGQIINCPPQLLPCNNALPENPYYSSVPRHFGRPVGINPIFRAQNSVPYSHGTNTNTGDTAIVEDFQSTSTGSLMMEDLNDSVSTRSNSVSDRGFRPPGMKYCLNNITSQQNNYMENGDSMNHTPPGSMPMTNGNNNGPTRQGGMGLGRPQLDPQWLQSVHKQYPAQSSPHQQYPLLKTSPEIVVRPNPLLSVIEEANTASMTASEVWHSQRNSAVLNE